MGGPGFSGQVITRISCCGLPVHVLVVRLERCAVAERRVETFGIVPELNVPGHIFARVFPGGVDGAVDPFHLDRGIKRLGLRIVETLTG